MQWVFALVAAGALFVYPACSEDQTNATSQGAGARDASADGTLGHTGGASPRSTGGVPGDASMGAGGNGGSKNSADASIETGAGGNGGSKVSVDASIETGAGGIGAGGIGTGGTPPREASVGSGGCGKRVLDAGTGGTGSTACVADFSTSGFHTCAVRTDGTVWCWGDNQFGELGDRTTMTRTAPTFVSGLGKSGAKVAAGEDYTCASKADGTVWCWGYCAYVGANATCGVNYANPTPVPVPGVPQAAAEVGAGVDPPCAILTDGTLWCLFPSPGEVSALGSSVAEVAVGNGFKCARKTDGTLWCWGMNDFGQLGDGTTTARTTPTQVTALATDVAGVAAGGRACAVKKDGTVWCWGGTVTLADGSTPSQTTPVQVTSLGSQVSEVSVGAGHACARKTDRTLWCWGYNRFGQLGDGTTVDEDTPVRVTALGASVTAISAGGDTTCAKKSDGTLWCWGKNDSGQLGNGAASPRACTGFEFDSSGQRFAVPYPCETSPVAVAGLCEAVADIPPPVEVADGGCSIATAAWPASAAATDPKCVPNCDAPDCASYCPAVDSNGFGVGSGAPCDTGCCASSVTKLTHLDTGCCGPGWATVATTPSGGVYYGTSEDVGVSGNFTVYESDDDGATWRGPSAPDFITTDPTFSGSPIASAYDPQFAFGGSGACAAEYGAYGLAGTTLPGSPPPPWVPPLPVGRLGVTVAGKQVWEDLPDYGPLAAEPSGAALLLTKDHVLRRTGRGTWDAICLPQAGARSAIAVDPAGAWYIAQIGTDGMLRVSRRDSSGGWSTETLGAAYSFVAPAIAVGAGTVHVAFVRSGNLYYSRRVGTSWVEHVVLVGASLFSNPPASAPSISLVYLAVDACGSPHFGVYANGDIEYDAYYFRWTPIGWVGAPRSYANSNPQLFGGIALTKSSAILPLAVGDWSVMTIPLR